MPPLKIAFDAKRLFHNREGLGAYARTLVRDLKTFHPEHHYFLCTPSTSGYDYAREFLDQSQYQLIMPEGRKSASLWRSKGVLADLEKRKIDVYWGLSNELPFGMNSIACKSIVTIHDLLFKTFPQQFSLADRIIYQRKFKAAVAASDLIVVPSQHTQRDLSKYFPNAQGKQVVLGQAIAPVYRGVVASVEQNDGQAYYLIVGSINERKNLRLVIEAWGNLSDGERCRVVVVGRGARYMKQMQELIATLELDKWFEFRSDVNNAELKQLYMGARALLFTSHYEGYGRPIVEALSLGIPVICGNNSSLPEVVGKHGIIIEYHRPEAFGAAIVKMNQEAVRKNLMVGVKEHLTKFDPQQLSNQAIRLMSDIVGIN